MVKPVVLNGNQLTVFDVIHVARDHYLLEIDDNNWARIRASRRVLEKNLEEGASAYGVTTGVGSQKDHSLSQKEVQSFNQRLLVAHATVANDDVYDPEVVRAAMVIQLNGFVTGKSAVREKLVRLLLERLRLNQTPPVSSGGSVGASDLVPLAQLGLSLIGVANPLTGEAAAKGKQPFQLGAKEALALMNSNALALGHGAMILLQARKLLRGFDLSACLSLEGFRGNLSIIDETVLAAHPEPGQLTASRHWSRLTRNSELLNPEVARFLQDPLSFRCAPQVHGAGYTTLEWVWKNWELEMNTVQDNPLVDADAGRMVSHGNMDSTLLTLGMDTLRASLATVVGISAQRIHKLHWPAFSGLPAGLAESESPLGGVQFLNLSHIAESFAAKTRAFARPALLNYQGQLADGVEDHATLLPMSLWDTERLIEAAWVVQALEHTVAAWAIRRRGIDLNSLGEGLRDPFAKLVPHLPIGCEGDVVFDLRPIIDMVKESELVDMIDDEAPPVPRFPDIPEV